MGSRASALVVIACLVASPAALARGRHEIHSRVDLASGTVTQAPAPPAASTAAPVTPRAPATLVASYHAGTVTVRTVGGKDVFKRAVGKLEHEWMPWSLFQPGLFVFAWRERVIVPGRPEATRDVLHAIDLATGTELWRRESIGAAPVGELRLVVHTGSGFDLVDSRTGKVERPLSFSGGGLRALAIAGGATLIDTGQVLARFDARGALVWRVDNLGALLSVTPLAQPAARYLPDLQAPAAPVPSPGAWVVVTASRLAVIDPATGKVQWSAPSSSPSMLIDGAQLLTTDIARDPAGPSVTIKLLVRELATGKVVRELVVVRHTHFFDTVTAVIAAKRGDLVDVTTELTVLD